MVISITVHQEIEGVKDLQDWLKDISTSSLCCLFPATLLVCCLRGVHGMKDSDLLFAPAVSTPAISFARSASLSLVPIGRLHLFSKKSTSPACFKKVAPSMSAFLNFSTLSLLSAFGRSCWIHSSSSSASNSFIPSIMGFAWLVCEVYMAVDRTAGGRRNRRSRGETKSRSEH